MDSCYTFVYSIFPLVFTFSVVSERRVLFMISSRRWRVRKKEKCFNVHCTLQFMRVYNVRSRYLLSLQSFSLLFLEAPLSLLPQSLCLLSLSSLFLLFLMYTKAFHLINRSIVLQRVLALECVAGISQIYTGCTLPLKPGCTWSCNDGLSDIRGLF